MVLRGINITLYKKTEVGKDAFNKPIFETEPVVISNVLIAPVTPQDMPTNIDLTGRKVTYQLAIPKGDENEWEDVIVEFWGKRWKTVAIPTEGIEHLIPLSWNKKVLVERYG